MIVSAANCIHSFFDQGIIKVGVVAWSFRRLSAPAISDLQVVIPELWKRDVQKGQRHMEAPFSPVLLPLFA
jgi:hypothetical protein